jgi:transcription elongation factor GreA
MTGNRTGDPIPGEAPARHANGDAPMTAASLEQLRDELEQLRRRSRAEIAQRLRDARQYGDGSNNDESHAIREEQLVLEARIASLQGTIETAVVIDPDDYPKGAAAIGSLVVIEDLASRRTTQYRLVSAHDTIRTDTITAGSPMGQALIGATPGAILTVKLPNARIRRVRLVDIKTDDTPTPARPKAA